MHFGPQTVKSFINYRKLYQAHCSTVGETPADVVSHDIRQQDTPYSLQIQYRAKLGYLLSEKKIQTGGTSFVFDHHLLLMDHNELHCNKVSRSPVVDKFNVHPPNQTTEKPEGGMWNPNESLGSKITLL